MSIVEVAKVAGVSHTTVANVINRRPGVSPDIIDRVEKAIQETGYVPPPPHKRRGPRSNVKSAGGRTGNIAVLCSGMSQSLISGGIYGPLLHGIQQSLSRKDMAMVFVESPDPGVLPKLISPNRIDGLIFSGKYPKLSVVKQLRQFPCVFVLGSLPHGSLIGDHVTPNDQSVGWLAANHLIERGHDRLACIIPQHNHPAFNLRAQAFQFSAKQRDVDVSVLSYERKGDFSLLIEPGGWDSDTIELVDQVLEQSLRPTGLFIPSDYHAALAHRHIRRKGIRLGRDIEIVGCNNEFSVLLGLEPRPATIDIRADEIGSRAVELLLGRMTNQFNRSFVHVMVEPTLIEGDASRRYEWNGAKLKIS